VPEPTFSEQWTAKALDTVDALVATVHDKAVRPAIIATRAVVFGVIIGVVSIVVVTLLVVGLFRLIVVYSPHHHVWLAYLVLGALFFILGMVLYSKRGSLEPADA
jgi:uncharacterized YccA/Bax inhibitor family protein